MYVSLKDVAARSGVSFQTASKVLNNHPGVVSDVTRKRIFAAARELGYVPNALARGLVRQASFTIGLLADDFGDPALTQIVMGAQRVANAENHVPLIVSTEPDLDPASAVRKLREHRVAGILVAAPRLENDPRLGDALRGPLPVVSVNHVPGGGIPLVGSDHDRTGVLAAEHLLALGHRDIATVTGPRVRRVVISRLHGFRRTLREAGDRLPASRTAEADWTAEAGYAAAHRLLDADPAVTAIFVHNDVMAVGVLAAVHERDLHVPEDCSVVSCDDLPFARYVTPALTTVHLPLEETGERAATLLLDSVRGEPVPRRELLPTHLVVRRSTAPPSARRSPPSSRSSRRPVSTPMPRKAGAS